MAAKKRKLGSIISEPIEKLYGSKKYDSLVFIENDHEAAVQTRAAALMYIHRNDLNLTTSVKDDEIWVMKDKDYPGPHETVDLRMVLA